MGGGGGEGLGDSGLRVGVEGLGSRLFLFGVLGWFRT